MERDPSPVIEAFNAGYRLAPAVKDGKAGLGRWNEREYDLEEILWHLRKGNNVAVKMGQTRQGVRICVLDLDAKGSRIRERAREMGFASEMEIVTASGKRHVYGRVPANVSELRTRIKALGRNWDMKATGIVLFPDSRIGLGSYRIPRGKAVLPPGDLPDFVRLGELLGEVEPNEPNVQPAVRRVIAATRRDIRNPRGWLLRVESHQFRNGSAGLTRACCVARDCGWSPEETYRFLTEEWNQPPRVTPPWQPEDIARCIARHFTQ